MRGLNQDIIKGQRDNAITINYNKWMFDSIRPYVGNKVLDIGAGLGNFLPFLLNREKIVAIDVLDIFIDELRKSYAAYDNLHIFNCDVQNDKAIEIAHRYGIDTVICNNVLEHIDDDLKALTNINAMLRKKGCLILVLPAFKFLYSRWDESVGHFRRYSYRDIAQKLAQANFSIESKFYMNSVGFFAWFINGRVLRNTPTKSPLVRWQALFFDRYIVNPLRSLESLFHPPFGQSLIIIARPFVN